MTPPGRRRTVAANQDRLIRAERRRLRREATGWRGRAAVPLAVAGGALFLVGNITSRLGVILIPFDQHHVVSQLGGGVVIMIGLGWLGRNR
ncbi:MAG: hypothetical protein ACRDY6_17525 [Acidimicrobiia bacterium]